MVGRLLTDKRLAQELLDGERNVLWVRRHVRGHIKFTTMWGTVWYWRETESLQRWAETVVVGERKRRQKRWRKREARARKALARKTEEMR